MSPKFRFPVFDTFERIRVINLPKRRDRRLEMERQLKKVGLLGDPRVAFFPAIACNNPGKFASSGAHGNFLSFRHVLREAVDANQSVLILEDDCNFRIHELLDYRLNRPCDVFYGGYHASNPDDLHQSDIIGAHFMGFSKRGATVAALYLDRYLSADLELDRVAVSEPHFDPAIRPPTDGAFVWMRRAYPDLTTEFAMLSYQRSSRTDIGDQRLFDRISLVRNIAGFARRTRGICRASP